MIIVCENQEMKIFELNNSGRLKRPFGREKSRKISTLFDKLASTSTNNESEVTDKKIDITNKPNLESFSYLFNQTSYLEDEDPLDSLMIDLSFL